MYLWISEGLCFIVFFCFFCFDRMVNTKVTPAKPGHRCSLCGKRYPTENEWKEHTLSCARERRDELNYECPECDYATRRERDLKRHSETHTSAKEKPEESTDLGKDPGDLFELIGLKEPSTKASVPKKKKAEVPEFAPPKKVFRISAASSSDSLSASDGKKRNIGTQTEQLELCGCGIQTSPRRRVHRVRTKVTTYREDDRKVKETNEDSWYTDEDC